MMQRCDSFLQKAWQKTTRKKNGRKPLENYKFG